MQTGCFVRERERRREIGREGRKVGKGPLLITLRLRDKRGLKARGMPEAVERRKSTHGQKPHIRCQART